MSRGRKPPTQRQLRVGEAIRHALGEVFVARRLDEPDLDTSTVTITEVTVSPDLRHATVYVRPLLETQKAGLEEALNAHARRIRGLISPALRSMKYMPRLHFRLDTLQDKAARIDALLKDPRVQRDIEAARRREQGEEGEDEM
ncbi:30S ribosome-binding factor RbfA [Thermopetrobacter sp. TC1]|uniref:30S ribosome-binding factor RbfA n=1 Tax=Thermopetrobacter sp. TC1 TaxID=1495045 RepID=UPI0005709CF2|nr:30S ribosome-binding factor RbfA [Thermopetrobacter sp. TC1]